MEAGWSTTTRTVPNQRRFSFIVNAGTVRQLMRWCEQWTERRFAI